MEGQAGQLHLFPFIYQTLSQQLHKIYYNFWEIPSLSSVTSWISLQLFPFLKLCSYLYYIYSDFDSPWFGN